MIALFQDDASNSTRKLSEELLYRNSTKGCHADVRKVAVQFELVLKGRSFSRAAKLILGGAALQRCD
jgi:hypothetical protein